MIPLTRSLKLAYILGLAVVVLLLSQPNPAPAQRAPVAPMLQQVTQQFWQPAVQQSRMMMMMAGSSAGGMMGMGGMGMGGMGMMGGGMGMRGGMGGMMGFAGKGMGGFNGQKAL